MSSSSSASLSSLLNASTYARSSARPTLSCSVPSSRESTRSPRRLRCRARSPEVRRLASSLLSVSHSSRTAKFVVQMRAFTQPPESDLACADIVRSSRLTTRPRI
jgi:hypothetical protein